MTRLSDTWTDDAPGDNPLTAEGSDDQQERRWYFHNFRSAAGRGGSAYGLARDDNMNWHVLCYLPSGDVRPLGIYDFETGLRVQDYCVKRDTVVKMALIELWERSNSEPFERLLEDAQAFGELPRRLVRLKLEVQVELRGTDAEIENYVLQHCRGASGIRAARVIPGSFDGPRIEEPSPGARDL